MFPTEEATFNHDSDPEGETLKMPNISQGILDDLLPNQEGSLSRSKKKMPPAVSRLTSQLSQEDFGKDTSVGTEAVIETDGQLDPKLGEEGERPDKNQSKQVRRTNNRELIPFTFRGCYARCFNKP